MARNIIQLAVASAILLHTEAYRLSFYTDAGYCAGEFLGSWTGGPAQGCQTEFVGSAFSVVIQSTGRADDDINTIARFYSSTDCSEGTEISEGNIGCVGVAGGGFGSYQSFSVEYTPLNDLPILPSAISVTSTIAASGTSIEAMSVQTDTRMFVTPAASLERPPFVHGEISYHKDIPYRWQQVHASGFIGIPLEEWDDNVHIQNLLPPPSLADCQIAATYTNRLIFGATFGAQGLAGTVEAYWAQVAALAAAQKLKISNYMGDHPFYQDIVSNFGLLTNWLRGMLTSANPANIANCLVQQTQLDDILSACRAQMVTITETSWVTVTALDTVTNTVTIIQMSIVNCGQIGEGDQCGLPIRTSIAGLGQ